MPPRRCRSASSRRRARRRASHLVPPALSRRQRRPQQRGQPRRPRHRSETAHWPARAPLHTAAVACRTAAHGPPCTSRGSSSAWHATSQRTCSPGWRMASSPPARPACPCLSSSCPCRRRRSSCSCPNPPTPQPNRQRTLSSQHSPGFSLAIPPGRPSSSRTSRRPSSRPSSRRTAHAAEADPPTRRTHPSCRPASLRLPRLLLHPKLHPPRQSCALRQQVWPIAPPAGRRHSLGSCRPD
mmetsp:Transcript_3285/g.10132  ORF Transcript_3285/g.10132 Transcript_3285/m.10132 type:complete len:240 (-) Transcript_3285:37-756(-)